MHIRDLKGKRVAIWGLGKEGSSALTTLRSQIPNLPITVLSDSPFSTETISDLQRQGVKAVAGAAARDSLTNFDVVIKSPGISLYRPEIQAARARRVFFTSPTQIWFSKHGHEKIICVSGTKGKSTTASLLNRCFTHLGLRTTLAGNVGKPLLDFFAVKTPPDIWVIELSSYQTSDLDASPSVGVLLNLFPEHLDWHGNIEQYYRDKLNLFAHMTDGTTILNREDPEIQSLNFPWKNPVYFNDSKSFHFSNEMIYEGKTPLLSTSRIQLPGAHNFSNICAALTVLRTLGLDPTQCMDVIAGFQGLQHRLMPIGSKDNILFVDDSVSTTPQSTIAAVRAFPNRPVSVLVGGFDRGLDYTNLAQFFIAEGLHAVITMPDTGSKVSDIIKGLMAKKRGAPDSLNMYEAKNLEHAVEIGKRVTPAGGVVLLSPGAPSYNSFKNFQERGLAFASAAQLSSIPARPG